MKAIDRSECWEQQVANDGVYVEPDENRCLRDKLEVAFCPIRTKSSEVDPISTLLDHLRCGQHFHRIVVQVLPVVLEGHVERLDSGACYPAVPDYLARGHNVGTFVA